MSKKIDYCECQKFLDALDRQVTKNGHLETTAFDDISKGIFWRFYTDVKDANTSSRLTLGLLAKRGQTTIKRIRTRLKHLARYGIIKIESPWRDDGSGMRDAMVTIVNPVVYICIGIDRISRQKLPLIKHLAKIGIERLEFENDVQGFRVNCGYGYCEPENAPLKAETELVNIVARESNAKALKAQESLEWRERGDIFIEGASDMWIFSQSKFGFGTSKPNWSGPAAALSQQARRERSELIKTFQHYGGRVTALAWYIFVGGITQMDERGKPKFTLNEPHRQYVTFDKKPSSFTKHFNAIVKDEIFVDFARNKWHKLYTPLQSYFKGTLDVKPRFETELALIGFEFGIAMEVSEAQ